MMLELSAGVITPEELSARMRRSGFRLVGTAHAHALRSGRICTTLTLDNVADLGLRARAREAALRIAGVERVWVDPGLPRRLYLLHW